MSDGKMCYGIRYPGHPGYGTIMADDPICAKDNAKEIAKAVRSGFVVERIPLEAAKAGLLEYLKADSPSPVRQEE